MPTPLLENAPGAGRPVGGAPSILAGLLPAAVASAETREPLRDGLFPAEEPALAGAGERRRDQFTRGRVCARRALGALGITPQAIPVGPRGAPVWPPGTVGSITHCAGYCAAAVAGAEDVVALGIDAEPNTPLPPRAIARVASERELAAIDHDLVAREGVSPGKLLFSAKEAVYKAWFPLTGAPLGLRDVELTIDLAGGRLEARPLISPARLEGGEISTLSGRWCARDGIVCVAVVLARSEL
jgi:enterobactin synthetase component D / holo-[acyl-carrier protein] synthase